MHCPFQTFTVRRRKVYGWDVEGDGRCLEVHNTPPPYFGSTRYLGLVCQHESGKWAATWNKVPGNDRGNYPFDTVEEAVGALPLYHADAWMEQE